MIGRANTSDVLYVARIVIKPGRIPVPLIEDGVALAIGIRKSCSICRYRYLLRILWAHFAARATAGALNATVKHVTHRGHVKIEKVRRADKFFDLLTVHVCHLECSTHEIANIVRLTVSGTAILFDDTVHDGISGTVLNTRIRALAAWIEGLKRRIGNNLSRGEQDSKAHH